MGFRSRPLRSALIGWPRLSSSSRGYGNLRAGSDFPSVVSVFNWSTPRRCPSPGNVRARQSFSAGDVRMRQPGRQLSFTLEPLPILGIGGHFRRQHLQRVLAWQPRMLRQIHLPHPARAQHPQDGLSGKHLAGLERHGQMVDPVICRPGPAAPGQLLLSSSISP